MNYSEDLKICEAATEGPWEVRKWDGDEWPEKRLSLSDGEIALAINPRYTSLGAARKDFEYIAHFNPTYVTQLIKQAQRCEELEKGLRRIMAIEDNLEGGDWDEIEEARNIAKELLK